MQPELITEAVRLARNPKPDSRNRGFERQQTLSDRRQHSIKTQRPPFEPEGCDGPCCRRGPRNLFPGIRLGLSFSDFLRSDAKADSILFQHKRSAASLSASRISARNFQYVCRSDEGRFCEGCVPTTCSSSDALRDFFQRLLGKAPSPASLAKLRMKPHRVRSTSTLRARGQFRYERTRRVPAVRRTMRAIPPSHFGAP